MTMIERFWSKVKKSPGCWMWDGSPSKRYGYFRTNRTRVAAHRFSWEIHNGEIPPGLCVLHRCDVAKCVRPDHLFLGSQLENIADRDRKGRTARGEKLGHNRGDRNGTHTMPERVARGDRNWAKAHPELMPRGEQVKTAKLTRERVAEILSSSMRQDDIARKFGVSQSLISAVRLRQIWKHVEVHS